MIGSGMLGAIPRQQGVLMSAEQPPESPASAANRPKMIADLHELVEALDRRVPHPDRAGETAIARDSAGLKKAAENRIAQLEDTPEPPE
jgi:hypothetical protein